MMSKENDFLQQNYKYFQAWHHWLGKAKKLKRASSVLYEADLPELRLYDEAYQTALQEIGDEGKAPIRHPHPDLLPAFSLYGSALESLFKAIIIHANPCLVNPEKLSPSLKSHNLIELAKEASVTLSEQESALLAWVTEVLIWKARYSVPTNIRFGNRFFHRLDNMNLRDAEGSMAVLDQAFSRAEGALPEPEGLSVGFDVLIAWREE